MPNGLSFDNVKNIIESHGDKLLQDNFINTKIPIKIQCGTCDIQYNQKFYRYKMGIYHPSCPNRKFKGNEKPSIVKVPAKCLQCESVFIKKYRKQKLCSRDCAKLYLFVVKNLPDQIESARKGGQISAANQPRRSKNEIYFSQLCDDKFDILTNERMFDGWDADVIIPKFKIAIHWNGIWHYKKVNKKHNVDVIKNRDQLKLKIIEKHGYKSYIIKDMGKADKTFVEREFEKFMNYIYFI